MALEDLQYSKDDLSFSHSHIRVFIFIWASEHILSEMVHVTETENLWVHFCLIIHGNIIKFNANLVNVVNCFWLKCI